MAGSPDQNERELYAVKEQLDGVKKRLGEAIMSTHRQVQCINECAAHIGPDTSATIRGLPLAVKRVVAERDKSATVCDQILSIMATYHEQDASPGGVGTPGGLEHMGDVWRLFRNWETLLNASASESEAGGGGAELADDLGLLPQDAREAEPPLNGRDQRPGPPDA